MKKIHHLFAIKYNPEIKNKEYIDSYNEPWANYAFNGIATRKWDGTCCLFKDAHLWKRYKCSTKKKPPVNFVEENIFNGKIYGWLPVSENDPSDKYHIKAFISQYSILIEGQTYELLGPKIQGNIEQVSEYQLRPHGVDILIPEPPLDFHNLRSWFIGKDIEGVVWHYKDKDEIKMVKAVKKLFNLKREN